MKKLLFLAAAATLAVGCETSRGSSMGYYYTDDGLPGCAFRYGYYPYYDANGPAATARMDIARVERVPIPREINRDGAGSFSGWTAPPAQGSGELSAVSDRTAVVPPAPAPPAPRIVAPRS